MPSSHISIGPESTIDISHESIMRVWTRLRKWVEEESRSAGLYLRLSKSAELYQEGKTGLWINPELQLALQWKDQAKPNATWAMRYDPAFDRAMTFLLYSKKQHELELVKKEAQQKRNLKRARTSAVVLGIAAIVSILFLLISLNLRFKAEASRKVALEKEKLAVSKSREMDEQRREAILQKKISEQQQQIAEQQKIITEEQRQYAVEQQGIAQEKTQVAIKEQKRAEESRRQALQARDAEETQRKAAVAQKEIADRERVKAESSGKESRRLRLLAISRSMAIQAGLLHNTVKDDLPALLALESFRLNAENGGSSADPAIYAALADISGDQQILRGHEDGVRGEALTTDGKTLFTCGDDNRLLVWKIDEPQSPPATFSIPKQARGTVRCVAVTPDSYWLIAGTTGGDLLLWKRGTVNEPAIVLRAHSGIVNALAMNPAGGTFASAGADGKLLVWNGSKEPFTRSVADSSSIKINCAAFSPDGKTLAWGTASGQVKTLLLTPSLPHSFTSSPPNSLPPSLLPSAMNGIQCLTYSPDGRWLAAGLASGTILAWETASPAARPHEILGRHLSGVNALAFSPDGKMLASASFDRTIKMSGFPDPESNPISIQNHELWVYGTLFTPDGSRLISCSADKTIRIFTTASERIAAALMKKITRNMTPDEWRKMVGSDIPYQKTREDLPVPDNSSNTSN